MRISAEEFKKYANNPDWYIESWMGCALGPGNYMDYLDEDNMIDCSIDEEMQMIIVY